MSTEKPKLLQLAKTGEWVQRIEAKNTAKDVYREFAMNKERVEPLARLALVAVQGYPIELTKYHIDDATLETLVNWRYLAPGAQIDSLTVSQTLRAQIAANMIEPDAYEGEYSGYLVEPFTFPPIINDLFSTYLQDRVDRRTKSNAD